METKIAYYPGAKPTARITPVRVKASRQGVAELLDMQGAWVGSIGDLSTARYVARCINANEKLVAALQQMLNLPITEVEIIAVKRKAVHLLREIGEAS